jgi:enoyl-CoA hydratase/carnithine racemase
MGRRRQWGSVRKLASGRYQARLPDGSPAPETFPTKADAGRWLSLAEADLVRGTFVHPSLNANVTVAEWLQEWRASHSLHKRPTTLLRDESAIRRHLVPRLGDIQLAKLRQTDVQAFVADLRREVGPGTTRSIYGVMRAALNAAVNAELLARSPDRTLYTLRQLRKPIFAAVNGIAYGGGSEIAQSTDFIIASENATFGQPEAMIGLAAGGGSPALLPRVLPPGKALQMLMTGDPITAQEAHRLGMVNEIYPQAELMDSARRIADKIASNSPTAVQAVKRAVRMGEGQPIEQAIAIMMEAHWRSAVHPDRIEGIGAFNDNREPTFQDSDY